MNTKTKILTEIIGVAVTPRMLSRIRAVCDNGDLGFSDGLRLLIAEGLQEYENKPPQYVFENACKVERNEKFEALYPNAKMSQREANRE